MSKPLALIVEDDPSLNQIFSKSLQEEFEIDSFTDGETAFERLAHVTPRLVLLDLNLPGESGAALLGRIRSTPHLQDTTVVLCTADDRQAEYLHDMADFVLLKPISPRQLRQLTSRLK